MKKTFEERQIEWAKDGQTERVYLSNEIGCVKSVNKTEGTSVWDVSTMALDAHKSIVNVQGIDFSSRYYSPTEKKNPIVLFMHDHHSPIGNSNWVKVVDGVLKAEKRISDKSQTAKDIRALVNDDVIRASSIGFFAKEQSFDDSAKKEFEKDTGLSAPNSLEWYIKTSELIELSIVSVGSNRDTLKNGIDELSPFVKQVMMYELLDEKFNSVSAAFATLQNEYKKELSERDKQILDKVKLEVETLGRKAGEVSPQVISWDIAKTILSAQLDQSLNKVIKKKMGIVD